jgi:ABC-type antimicrobial peptide transport system permease subunit
MTLFHLIAASLRYHFRIHAAVALGVLVATAVLTGALLVGDSMRGSLRRLTLERLGEIDELLVTDRFFRKELAQELAKSPEFEQSGYKSVAAAILIANSSIERQDGGRASGVLTIGCDEQFFGFFLVKDRDSRRRGSADSPPAKPIAPGEVILNEPLAKELKAKIGDTVVLRLPSADQVAADSPLGRKEDRVRSVPELRVVQIYAAEGVGRFALRPNQALPFNAYVSPETLQDALEQSGRMNALLVGRNMASPSNPTLAHDKLAAALRPRLDDYGLKLRRVTRKWHDETAYDYFELTSTRMLLEPELVKAALSAFAAEKPQVLFTYLANRIENVNDPSRKPASYSTICAVDTNEKLGPTLDAAGKLIGPLTDDEIVVNDWVERDQQLKPGDKVRLVYFEPETTHGQNKETSAEFTLRGIAPLTTPPEGDDARPTPANDPDLTPEVPGVTDAQSISKWNAPFKVDYGIVRPADDKYWEDYRTTPKAFISLAAGQRLWGSRWGDVTAVRFPARAELEQAELERQLLDHMRAGSATLGLEFQPIKQRDLAASAGTTHFDALFLGLSLFIVAAAVILVLLLFRLGVEQRASEIGVLLGLGWTRQRVAQWLIEEGVIVAAIGAALGVLGGVGYAWLMIVGLTTWWRGAVGESFLELFVTPKSLAAGYSSGVAVSVSAIWWGLRQSRHVAIRQLLAGQATSDAIPGKSRLGWLNGATAALLLACAVGLAFLATRLQADAQAGAFLGSGAAVLAAVLLLVRQQLRGGVEVVPIIGAGPLARLALRSAARNPSRSVLTLALVSSAGFLIVALSAFRLDPSQSGSGGFEYVAESAQPVLINLNDEQQREEVLADDAALLKDGTILSLRLQPGDDASCRNLYQAAQPRVLGVPPAMIEYYDDPAHKPFAWSASGGKSPLEKQNPWRLLSNVTKPGEPVPVVLDQNTAMYSLQLYNGVGETFSKTYPGNQTITFRVVGLLSNSVLQGSLLVGESNFQRLFPLTSGYRYFLIHAPADPAKAAIALEDHLSDQGFDAKESRAILTDLMAVQNTYLSTFQALGALGLVLGTFGLAAVQVRSVLERRGELGLLRAEGYANSRLSALVMLENVVLLLGGLAIGVIAALVAVLPHALVGGARPPWLELAVMLGLVAVVGSLVGWLSVRGTLQVPLIAALRGE